MLMEFTKLFVYFLIFFVVTLVIYTAGRWVTLGPVIQGVRVALYCGLVGFVVVVVLYLLAEPFFDHVEPAVISISWLVWLGEPLYHGFDSPSVHMQIYGPFLFLIQGVYFGLLNFLFGVQNIGVTLMKLIGTGPALLGMVCMYAACRSGMRRLDALLLTALVATECLIFGPISFYTRADPLLFLLVSSALLIFVKIENLTVKAILIGIIGGMAANVKIFAPIYFLPIALLMWCRHGVKGILTPVVPGALVLAAPFISAQFDIAIYLQHIISPKHRIELGIFFENLRNGAFLMVPFVAALIRLRYQLGDARREILLYCSALIVTGVVVARTGAIPGGGPWHYLPLLPLIAFGLILVRQAVNGRIDGGAEQLVFFGKSRLARALAGGFAILLLLQVGINQYFVVKLIATRFTTGVVADIREILQKMEGGNVHMGYGATRKGYHLTYYRPLLVFGGHGYFLDSVAVMDLKRNGIPIPPAVRERVASCEFRHWLIPRDEEPFAMRSVFPPRDPLFDRQFRDLFRATFRKSGSTRFYDIWSC